MTQDFNGPLAQTGIGVIVPYDMALDRELWRWTPDDVSLYFTRTPYASLPVSIKMAEHVAAEDAVRDGVRDLHAVSPQVYAYGCTSGSFVGGVAGEQRLVDTMQEAGAPYAVTASGALVAAMQCLNASSVAVATPYDRAVTDRLTSYLGEAGVKVVESAHLGLTEDIWRVSYAATVDLIVEADHDAAEAIVVSCTNLPTYGVIASLERQLDKPVISANQALMWAVLDAIGRQMVGTDQRLAATSARH